MISHDNPTKKDYDAKYHYERGCLLGKQGKDLEAIKEYDRAISIDPNHKQAWGNKGNCYARMERYDDAFHCYDKALSIDPRYILPIINRAVLLGKSLKWEEALWWYERALEIEPFNRQVWHKKGLILATLGRTEEALKWYRKSGISEGYSPIKEHRLAMEQYNKGLTARKEGRNKEALNHYKEALNWEPYLIDAWINKGNCYYTLHKFELALDCYNHAISINSENDRVWGNKGSLLDDMGKPNEALECFDRAISLNPIVAEHYFNKGVVLIKLSRYREAIQSIVTALSLKADYMKAKQLLKHLNSQFPRPKISDEELARIKQDINNTEIHHNYQDITFERYDLSIKIPKDWQSENPIKPYSPENNVLCNLKYGDIAFINLVAGPLSVEDDYSFNDLERQAIKTIQNLDGEKIAIQPIHVQNSNGIEIIYTAFGKQSKKIAFNRGTTEFILTCGSDPEIFKIMAPLFDKVIDSVAFTK
jgi:tetratricopeptide (TPR) repeat protein